MKFYPCSIQIFMHDLCNMPTLMHVSMPNIGRVA